MARSKTWQDLIYTFATLHRIIYAFMATNLDFCLLAYILVKDQAIVPLLKTTTMELSGNEPQNPVEYPLLGERVQSSFIDVMLIIALMFFIASVLDRYQNPPDWVRIILFAGVWVVYEPLCTSLGCTLGNFIKGIRVRRFGSADKKINIFQALLRYVLKIGLGWISFLTIHSNPEKRAIHDFASGSVMIKV